jgi:hypothetical protein
MSINISECEIIEKLIDKLNNINNNLNKIKDYAELNDTSKSVEYLEELNNFSINLNELEANSEEIVNKYIMNVDINLLSSTDKLKRKKILIDKKIQEVFLPYMLYMQIILNSN